MTSIERARRRLRNVLGRSRVESEMEEEMRFHLEMEIEDRVRAGMSPEEARRTALRDFGGVERHKEEARAARGIGWVEEVAQDARFAVRALRRSPGFALVAVLTLGLGIGGATAIFSVVDGVLLRPLPFPAPERLVAVAQVDDEGESGRFSHPNFVDVRERSRSFAAIAAYRTAQVPVTVGGEAVRVGVAEVSADFFRVLGVRPAVGRGFLPEESRTGAPVAVVGHGYWRRHLGGTRDLAGRTVRVGDRVLSVVGVLPEGSHFPAQAGVWLPQGPQDGATRTGHNWLAVGRLVPGATPESAGRELDAIARELKRAYGDDTWMAGGAAVPLHEVVVGRVRPALLVLLGASGLLLLIAGANVVNLLLTRMAARRREVAVRLALGAGRGRLMRQFVAESAVLTLAGGALGVALAFAGVRALLALDPGRLPRAGEIGIDAGALLFALTVCAATAAGMGLLVAARASAGDVREALAEGSRGQSGGVGSQRVRAALAVAQVALTLVLLVGAGLLARSFLRLLAVDPGYRTSGPVALDLLLSHSDARPERLPRFHDELLARLSALPGVTAAGAVDVLPLSGTGGSNGSFLILDGTERIEGWEDFARLMKDTARVGEADYRIASPGYFRAMGIPLVRGRLFDERDHAGAPHVAVISRSLAETRWPGQDPIGKRIQFGNMDGDLRPFTVVGIVGDVREVSLDVEPRAMFYGSSHQRASALAGPLSVVVLGGGEPGRVLAAARQAARSLDPDVPVRTRPLQEVFAGSLADRRFSLVLLGAFAAVALVLAVTGIYGVISYLVAQRTREIGIRLALGARAGDVLRMVVRRGVRLALAGVGVGLLASLAGTRVLEGLLFGVSTTDALTFVAVPLLLTLVAALASYLPARRSTRVDPMIALRRD